MRILDEANEIAEWIFNACNEYSVTHILELAAGFDAFRRQLGEFRFQIPHPPVSQLASRARPLFRNAWIQSKLERLK